MNLRGRGIWGWRRGVNLDAINAAMAEDGAALVGNHGVIETVGNPLGWGLEFAAAAVDEAEPVVHC